MIDTLYVEGHGFIAPDAQVSERPDGAAAEPKKPDLALIERSLRRGLSDVSRLFFHAAGEALARSGRSPSEMRVLYASAFGEIGTAESLLKLAHEEDASSPARFRHSVHNTALGILSISAHNELPGTAIAAGWDTVAMALLEAHAELCDGAERLLLVFAEERVPYAFDAKFSYGPLGAAFVLAREPSGRALGRIRNLRRVPCPAAHEPFGPDNHPLAPAAFLCRALEEQTSRTLVVGEGDPPWCVDVDARRAS